MKRQKSQQKQTMGLRRWVAKCSLIPNVRIKVVAGLIVATGFLYFVWTWLGVRHDLKFVKPVKVVLVEEHHEVLKYWYEAAEKGIIPKTGNTLVHIDGHSDRMLPLAIDKFPFFRYPANKNEISAMMQRNDVFISGAVITGLFDRMIFIWPTWDTMNHQDLRYGHTTVDIGYTIIKNKKTKSISFCECMLLDGEKQCQYYNDTAAVGDDIEIKIPETKCNIKKSLQLEEVREDVAANKFEVTDWLKNASVVLDIDEDFFGCESGSTVLRDADIDWKDILILNQHISRFMCPVDAALEETADRFLVGVAQLIKEEKECQEDRNKCQRKPQRFKDILQRQLFMQMHSPNLEMFCSHNKPTSLKSLKIISLKMQELTVRQLEVLIDVGFCMNTSPKSYGFPNGLEFRVCHGQVLPEENIVTIHSPGSEEVDLRGRLLKRMFRGNYFVRPKLVTVARSMRDGYTPKQYFYEIEHLVLDALKSSMPKTALNVHYDKDLLGGKTGWPLRNVIKEQIKTEP